ncbi:GDSL esterase/lipase At3g26430-like [Rhodamnia argentea]|uniref:GDSL esterase/lipase At3g26430-like n=1 Tax=Rhodamnia argentea TaxID=178133 RepID=A0ABM3HJD2_9MYRT|nr:GDSL esterase/lipase At3g26430-like [Rhodamnia argentea]
MEGRLKERAPGLRAAVAAVALLLCRFPACLATAAACEFPAIFNFRGSNSDKGGLSAVLGQVPPPNGETYFRRLHGANFAVAGSPIRPQAITQGGCIPISLNVQLVEFSDFLLRSRQKGGAFTRLLPQEEYFSSALYTFDIGQNDLTSGLKQNMTINPIKADIPDVTTQFSDTIKVLVFVGVP